MIMKRIMILCLICMLFSCSKKQNDFDAMGTFEAT